MAVLCACLAAWLAVPPPGRPPVLVRLVSAKAETSWLRPTVALAAGVGAWVVVGGVM